jgi:alginate O-acetyltransferase complex protein AlgI
MIFTTVTFLFFFFPIWITLYLIIYYLSLKNKGYLFTTRICNLFLFISSLFFYIWGERLYLIIILSTVVNYFFGIFIEKKSRRFGLWLSVIFNLGILIYLKYYNFFLDNTNFILKILKLSELHSEISKSIIIPLGISFFSFKILSYSIDIYRGTIKAETSYINFATYVVMFPHIIAGPIVRYVDVAEQFRSRKISNVLLITGIYRFITGLSKKVLISDNIGFAVDKIYSLPLDFINPSISWLAALGYTLQIYFDFSGYSDMAIGIGNMIGFEVPENFNYPYIAKSIREFWRKWHISLSNWFRDYVYIMLGGKRVSSTRNYINLFCVFFLCGLWHGASWTFVIWGIYHGIFMILERFFDNFKSIRLYKPFKHCYTIIVIMIGWVIFRSSSLSQAVILIKGMFGITQKNGNYYSIWEFLYNDTIFFIIIGLIFSTPIVSFLIGKITIPYKELSNLHTNDRYFFSLIIITSLFFLFFISILRLSSGTYNPFIYFKF